MPALVLSCFVCETSGPMMHKHYFAAMECVTMLCFSVVIIHHYFWILYKLCIRQSRDKKLGFFPNYNLVSIYLLTHVDTGEFKIYCQKQTITIPFFVMPVKLPFKNIRFFTKNDWSSSNIEPTSITNSIHN